jgi:ribosomal protein S20
MNAYIEQRIEALTAAGRLDDAAIDKAVAKGLLKAEKAAGIKSKKPKKS